MELSYLASEKFIHRVLVRKAHSMVEDLLGRYLDTVHAMAFYWPAVEHRAEDGRELTVFIQDELPTEPQERRASMLRAVSNVRAYGLALLNPDATGVTLILETLHGAASWRVHARLGTGGALVRVEVTHEHLGFLWQPVTARC